MISRREKAKRGQRGLMYFLLSLSSFLEVSSPFLKGQRRVRNRTKLSPTLQSRARSDWLGAAARCSSFPAIPTLLPGSVVIRKLDVHTINARREELLLLLPGDRWTTFSPKRSRRGLKPPRYMSTVVNKRKHNPIRGWEIFPKMEKWSFPPIFCPVSCRPPSKPHIFISSRHRKQMWSARICVISSIIHSNEIQFPFFFPPAAFEEYNRLLRNCLNPGEPLKHVKAAITKVYTSWRSFLAH